MTIFKRILSIMTLLLILFMAFTSCNKEELFVDDNTEIIEEPIEGDQPEDDDEDDEKEEDEEVVIVDPNSPCEFTLENVESNSTVIINCILDLGEKTVNLPNNVELVFEGGDIINGTLNFSENSIIDGRFLNSTLNIKGSNPTTKSPIFDLLPNRWEIVKVERLLTLH